MFIYIIMNQLLYHYKRLSITETGHFKKADYKIHLINGKMSNLIDQVHRIQRVQFTLNILNM